MHYIILLNNFFFPLRSWNVEKQAHSAILVDEIFPFILNFLLHPNFPIVLDYTKVNFYVHKH